MKSVYILLIIPAVISLFLFSLFMPSLAQSVGADGSFSYSIPIELPEGTTGMAPGLALVYNSNSDNGILGVGWSLAGLPAITRDASIVINYDGTDHYIGPGGRLVITERGDFEGDYHYENESFCRIQAIGTRGDGPSYWIEIKPDGTKYYYGSTSNSKIVALNTDGTNKTYSSQSCVRVWALSKIEDIYGNYYTVEYSQDYGEYYPATITYTENSGFPINNYRTVEFGYNETSRRDYYSNHPYGSWVETRNLLTSISIKIDGDSVRTYTLNYYAGDTLVKSRLRSVYVDDGMENNTIAMKWNNIDYETSEWRIDGNYQLPAELYSDTNQTGDLADINGDGLVDFVTGQSVYLNTGTGFSQTPDAGYNLPWSISSQDLTRLADVNGDGLTDITGSGTDVYFNTGSESSPWSLQPDYFPESIISDEDYYYHRIQIGDRADIDGNEMIDSIISYNYIGTENKRSDLNFVTGNWFTDSDYDLPALFATSTGHLEENVCIDWDYEESRCVQTANIFYWNWIAGSKIRFADINGDGYTDCIINGSALLNTGNGLSTAFSLDYSPGSNIYGNDQTGELADINSDGLIDLVLAYKSAGGDTYNYARLNTGSGFSAEDTNYSLPGLFIDLSTDPVTRNHIRFADIDGDGLTDCIIGRAVYLRKGTVKNQLLTMVDNPLGGTTSISYSPAKQFVDSINDDVTDMVIDKTGTDYPEPVTDMSHRNLVARITTEDGRGNDYVKHYSYDNGRIRAWYPYGRKNLYFERVTERIGSNGPYTKTYYNQNNYYEGKITRIDNYSADRNLIKRQTYSYNTTRIPYSSELWTHLTSGTETTYEDGAANIVFTNTISYAYDDYGNIVEITETADGFPAKVTTMSYAADEGAWLLRRPSEIKQYATSTDGTLLKWQQFEYYDGTEQADVFGLKLKYKLKAKKEWLNLENKFIWTEFRYDEYGNIASVISPNAASGLSPTFLFYDDDYHTFPERIMNYNNDTIFTIEMKYDPATGARLWIKDYNGNETRYNYDSYGRLVEIIEPGDDWTKRYNYVMIYNGERPAGQYIETRTRDNSAGSFSPGYYMERLYIDGMMRRYKTVSEGYEANNRVVTYEYDSLGRLLKQSNPYLDGCDSSLVYYTTYSYDSAGRVSEKRYNVDSSSSYESRELFTYPYESGRQVTCFVDKNGTAHYSRSDSRSNLRSRQDDPSGINANVYYEYDETGRLVQTADAGGKVTWIAYDTLGRKTSITEANTGTTQYTYYDSGHIKTQKNANGKTLYYDYDSLNRLVRESSSDNTVNAGYYYDETSVNNCIGRLYRVTDDSGETRFSYDAKGNATAYIKGIDWNGDGAVDREFASAFEYDQMGRATAITYPDLVHTVIKRQYADAGYLKAVTDSKDRVFVEYARGTSEGSLCDQNSVKRTTWNGVTTRIEYDPANLRPVNILTKKGETVLENIGYGYDAIGNITKLTDYNTADGDDTESFTYDSLSRLTKAVSSPGFYGTRDYGFDAQGNLTHKESLDLNMTYNSLAHPHAVTSYDGKTYTYDAAGNMISRKGKTLVYDAKNRLIEVKNSTSGEVEEKYVYDYSGFRVIKKFSDGTVTYNINGLYEHKVKADCSDRFTLFIYGIEGEIVSQITGTAPSSAGIYPVAKKMYNWKDPKGFFLALHAYASAWLGNPANFRYFYLTMLSFALLGALALLIFNIFFRTAPFILPRWLIHTAPVLLFIFFGAFGLGCTNGLLDYAESGNSNDTPGMPDPDTVQEGIKYENSYFFHPNHVGSVKLVTNASGIVIANYKYSPYGELLVAQSSGTNLSIYKYTAQEEDSSTGLYYYNARFYDPETGRFISADTIVPDPTATQDFNRYMYVAGNPVKYSDPSGHQNKGTDDDVVYVYDGPTDPIIIIGHSDNDDSGSEDEPYNYYNTGDYYDYSNYHPPVAPPPPPPPPPPDNNTVISQQGQQNFFYIYVQAPTNPGSGSPWNPPGHVAVLDEKYVYELTRDKDGKYKYMISYKNDFYTKYSKMDGGRKLYLAQVDVPDPAGLRAAVKEGKADYDYFNYNCKEYALDLFEAGGVSRMELNFRSYASPTAIGIGIGVSIFLTPATGLALYLWGATRAPFAFSGLHEWKQ